MKNLFFKGVKIDSKVAPQLEAYVQKAYKCSFDQLTAIEQYDAIMNVYDSIENAIDAHYYNGVDALMVTSIGLPSSNEWLEDLDLEPQDSYYQW